MRFILAIMLIALCSFAIESFFPWWTIGPLAFIVAFLMKLRNGQAFLAGFLGIGLLWLLTSLIKDNANQHILSARMAELFRLPGPTAFVIFVSLVGALVGGLAAWSGALFRKNLL